MAFLTTPNLFFYHEHSTSRYQITIQIQPIFYISFIIITHISKIWTAFLIILEFYTIDHIIFFLMTPNLLFYLEHFTSRYQITIQIQPIFYFSFIIITFISLNKSLFFSILEFYTIKQTIAFHMTPNLLFYHEYSTSRYQIANQMQQIFYFSFIIITHISSF